MRCERDGFQVDAAEVKGRGYPDWYLEGPELIGQDAFYLAAFWRLSTCRQIGMGLGPIPWRDIVDYGARVALDSREIEVLVKIVHVMDHAYLGWMNSQSDDDDDDE